MHHLWMQPDAPAGGDEIAHRPVAHEVGQMVIRLGRHHQIDGDAAPRRQRQRRHQGGVRNEIRRHRQNALLRGETGRNEQRVDGVVDTIGAACHQLRQHGIRLRRRDLGRFGGRRLLAGERPVLVEHVTGLAYQIAGDVERQIEPRRAAKNRPRIALEVLGGKIAPTAPQMGFVGDDQFAVIAQIGPAALRRAERRYEAQHLDTGLAQRVEVGIAAHVDTDAVNQQPHPHAVACPRLQAFTDLVAERITAEDEGRDVERTTRAVDDVLQCPQRLATIGVNVQMFVSHRFGQAHGLTKLAHARRRGMPGADRRTRLGRRLRALCDDLAATEGEVQRQREIRQQDHAEHPGDRRRRMAPLMQAMRSCDVDDQSGGDQQNVDDPPVANKKIDQVIQCGVDQHKPL